MARYSVREMYFECVTKGNFNTVSDDFYKTSNQVKNTVIFGIIDKFADIPTLTFS